MSHYPTSAELASFRRSISHVVTTQRGTDAIRFSPLSGDAWPDEVHFGIPESTPHWDWQRAAVASLARREASRMRSRAFSALVATGPWPIGHGYEDGSRVCPIERSNGLPVEIGHYA